MAESDFIFESMSRQQSKLAVSVYGPSGSGKTVAILKLMKGIQEQLYPNERLEDIGLFIDTERRSSTKAVGRTIGGEMVAPAQLYVFEPPFDIIKLAKLIDYAVSKGKKIIAVDSYTAFWSGMDGILDRAAELDSSGMTKKAYGAWSEKEIIAKKNILKNLMTNTEAHIIMGFRAKTEYVMEPNQYGKMTPKAVGLKEDMQADVRFEFDTVVSLDKDTHDATVVKDRIGYLEIRAVSGNPDGPITVEDGKVLAKLASEGYTLEEVARMKTETYINYVLEEKAAHSSLVSNFEKAKDTELTRAVLEGYSYEQLTKLVKYLNPK